VLAEVIDADAHASSSPWLAVVLSHPHLDLGPVVAPGHGACYACWQRRRRQHADTPDVDAALERHFLEHPAECLDGYPPPRTGLAAAMTVRLVRRLVANPEPEAGWLRSVNLVTLRTRKGRGVGVHGCDRCGLGRNEAHRSHLLLGAAMEDALRWTA
jgi:bacteriocin biosynthesis cyclodehydratase domain-containing protein